VKNRERISRERVKRQKFNRERKRDRQEKNPALIPWGRKVETEIRLKRDERGGESIVQWRIEME
jgi:hypothetical protein